MPARNEVCLKTATQRLNPLLDKYRLSLLGLVECWISLDFDVAGIFRYLREALDYVEGQAADALAETKSEMEELNG